MKLTTGYKKPIASSGDDALELSSNNSYLLLAGGGHKALSELVSPADLTTALSNYVTIGSNQTITGVKIFSLAINADITGNASTATNVNWSGVTNRPTNVSAFNNDVGYVTTDTTYSTATSDTLGLVKIGYTANGKNYPVQLSNGQMYVNVLWTDTWRPITDSYSGTSSNTSLSQNGGKAIYDALVNGYATNAGNAGTLNGYTSDDFVLKTTHDVYESVIAEALNDLDSRKADIEDIPTSLPANGGNADYATSATTASKLGTANVGSGTQHFYLNTGTATASTSTVGGTAKPIYLKVGVMTAISDTIGSTSLPVYLDAGTITACTAESVFSNLSNIGNDLSVTVAGKNRTLTVAYASNADTVDELHLYTRDLGVNGTNWTFASTLNANATTHIYAPITAGTSGQILKSTGGTPTWVNTSDISAGKLNGYTANDFIQNITVRNVITGAPGTNAEVKATKTNSDVILDFTIPRGYQGDMAEKDDSGYTNSKGDTVVDYCEAILEWQFLSDPGLNCEFVNILQVPIPSYDLITSLIDCIKMTQKVTLLVGDKGQTYTWDQLHWSLQCSNKDGIVYVTKYGTNHTNFYFGVDNNGDPINAINTIEIVVRCEPDQTDSTVGVYYIQVTVENEYGRAYYTSTKISQYEIT